MRMSTDVKAGEPRLCYEGGVRLPVHDYPVEVDGQQLLVRVYDSVAYAGNLFGDEMKEFVAAFTVLALEAGWPLVIDERTAVPAAEYLGWSGRFKQTGTDRPPVM
jgi:hypothetical protein